MKRPEYDIIIIGSGLGGLECGAILSREGFRVCLLEQDRRIGGCLQSFRRKGEWFDTGMHYFGAMDPGEPLYRYFKYLGLTDRIPFRRLDETGFDRIRLGDREFPLAMGEDRFLETLSARFPQQRGALGQYLRETGAVYRTIRPELLRQGVLHRDGLRYMAASAAGTIERIVSDPLLQCVLAGPAALYGGMREHAPFYHHAMITASNRHGAFRIESGSGQIARVLAAEILRCGGTILTGSPVTRLKLRNGRIAAAEICGERELEARTFISAIHPALTFGMLEKTPLIRKGFLSRLSALPQTYGFFSLYLLLKPEKIPFFNCNYYLHRNEDAWEPPVCPEDETVRLAIVSCQKSSASAPSIPGPEEDPFSGSFPGTPAPAVHPGTGSSSGKEFLPEDSGYARSLSILVPIDFRCFLPWTDTRHGARELPGRESYREYTERLRDKVLDYVCERVGGLRGNIEQVYLSTPLTWRDCTGTPEGSAYGLLKSYSRPAAAVLPVRTKIENLLLTGQNINVHGALGVTLTAALTCAELLGTEYLAKKIGDA